LHTFIAARLVPLADRCGVGLCAARDKSMRRQRSGGDELEDIADTLGSGMHFGSSSNLHLGREQRRKMAEGAFACSWLLRDVCWFAEPVPAAQLFNLPR
jgi:hypothetical protein